MMRPYQTLALLAALSAVTAAGAAAQRPLEALGQTAEMPHPVGGASQGLPGWALDRTSRAPDDPPGFPGTPGGPQGPPSFPTAPAQVPIDGGLSLLAAAGAAYAARRLRAAG